jgi:site-specific DNA-cytosine methylase
MEIRTVEHFCGTKSFSRVAHAFGYRTLTVDNDPRHHADIVSDILEMEEIPRGNIVWASPPCEAFSVAAIGRNWNHDYTPKHERAFFAQKVVRKTMALIRESRSTWWFVENPRGMLRKLDLRAARPSASLLAGTHVRGRMCPP